MVFLLFVQTCKAIHKKLNFEFSDRIATIFLKKYTFVKKIDFD